MPLSCHYSDDGGDAPGPWYDMDCEVPYVTAPTLRRRKRCASCNQFINPGDTCTVHPRWTFPRTEVEAMILGGGCENWDAEIPLAPTTICEPCSDIFFSLLELGFAVFPHEDQHLLLQDYQSDFSPGERCHD